MIATRDVYVVPFQGEWIDCQTGLDAIAVKAANDLFAGLVDDASPAELHRAATILDGHGRGDDAQRLRTEAGRRR